MANLENAFKEILDVVSHMVTTHTKWNMDLTQEEAAAKVSLARVHAGLTEATNVVDGVAQVVTDLTKGNQ